MYRLSNDISRWLLSACLLVLGLSVADRLVAQELTRTRTYNIHDGLPSNYITQIAQDSRGVVWVSTWNGLSAYDGYRFINFRDGDNVMGSNRIYQMYPADDGLVWINSYDKRPFVLDSRTGTYHNIGNSIGLDKPVRKIYPRNGVVWIATDSMAIRISAPLTPAQTVDTVMVRVRDIITDEAGNEWLYTSLGLRAYGTDHYIRDTYVLPLTQSGLIYHLTRRGRIYIDASPTPIAVIPEVKNVSSFVPYNKNIILCATDRGIYAYHPGASRIVAIDESEAVHNADLHIDSSGRIWALMPNGSVYMSPSPAGRFSPVDVTPSAAGHTTMVNSVWIEDDYGTVWLAAPNSPLGYYDDLSGSIISYPIRSRLLNNAVIPSVEVSFVDSQNNLWLSSMHNLTLVNFCNRNLREVSLTDNDATRSVAIDKAGGIWLGSGDGTLARYASETALPQYAAIEGSRLRWSDTPQRFSYRIYSLLSTPDNTMWVGTKGMGLYAIADDGTVSRYVHNDDDPTSLPDDNIYDMDCTPDGTIWLATYGGGLGAYDPSNPQAGFVNINSLLSGLDQNSNKKVRRVTHTTDGTIIASCTDGLLVVRGNISRPESLEYRCWVHNPDDPTSIHSSHVMHTLAAADGSVYVAPLGEKVQRTRAADLLSDTARFVPLSDKQLHPFLDQVSRAGNVISLAETPSHDILLVMESCVVRYQPATATATSIGYNDLDRTIEFTEAKSMIDPHTGRLWAPTSRGAIVFDPSKVTAGDYTPGIVITNMISNGSENINNLNPARIVVPRGDRSVSVSFAALDYSNNELIQYSYRLDDDEWTYIGNTNTLTIGALSAGDHTLSIRSTNGDGIWTDNVHSVSIYVTPTFWESGWGIALIVCIVAIIILLGVVTVHIYRRYLDSDAEHRRIHDFIIGYISRDGKHKPDDADPQTPSTSAANSEIDAADRQFLDSLTAYIEANIGDEELRVEDMAVAVGMGRTALYAKLKSLVGMTPADFTRRMRIQHAVRLITDSDLSLSEIAYAVGFTDPKYFSRCFKKDTGMTPSAYRTNHTNSKN